VDPFTADSETISLEPVIVREQEALRGLKQVDGTVYPNRNQADDENAYAADLRFGARGVFDCDPLAGDLRRQSVLGRTKFCAARRYKLYLPDRSVRVRSGLMRQGRYT
jgi:hypothetical protein